jgi:mannosyl-oligosaccharide alpha-1,2-mannosidase
MPFALPRRRFLSLAAAAAAGMGMAGAPRASAQPDSWQAIADDVRRETQWAWQSYVDRAFGHDQIKPVSGGYEDFFAPGHPVGLTIVEALDTLWLMELDAELEQGVEWVKSNLSFDIDAPFQVFETNIRMVGGLLSGYHCTGEPRLLELAVDLTNRLLPAFTSSPAGIPYRYVNLRTGAVSRPDTNLAELGTYITEFGTLSAWTGDRRYFDAAKRALQVTFDRRSPLDLLPYSWLATTGTWLNTTATVGPPADSYYEYLWDGWSLFGDEDLRVWYETLVSAILDHQSEVVDGRLWFAQVDALTGIPLSREQSELASYFAGLLAEGGDIPNGRSYHDSWNAVQDRYGVLPEAINYSTLAPVRKGNLLRPEFADAALNLWLATGDDLYRHRAQRHYELMKATSKVQYGYTVLDDVTTNPVVRGDSCPGYWWSEQLKYYWLMFGQARRFNYDDHYLSTEGNLLKGAVRQ